MSKQWYIIDNLDDFVLTTRKLVFNTFGKNDTKESTIDELILDIKEHDQEEFDSALTQEEALIIVESLVKKQLHKETKQARYLLTEKIFMQLVEDLNSRMVSNILNNLVNKGLIESGFDEESNDFIFWVKDENKSEKPETD